MNARAQGNFESLNLAQLCPTCSQAYLERSKLSNPDRTIYVHQWTRKSKQPLYWCVDPSSRSDQQATLNQTIVACNESNSKSIERGVTNNLKELDRENKKMAQFGSRRSVMIPKTGSHDMEITAGTGFSQIGRGETSMAFVGFDLVKLREEFPSNVTGRGRVGKPSVAISDRGRITLSSEASKVMEGCKLVIPSRDKDNQLRLRFDGHADCPKGKEAQVIELSRAKPAPNGKQLNKSVALQGVMILKHLGYDFVKAGNQTYEVEKMDQEKHVVVFLLPTALPAKKPKQQRKTRVVKSASASASAAAASAAPPIVTATKSQTDDLVIEE